MLGGGGGLSIIPSKMPPMCRKQRANKRRARRQCAELWMWLPLLLLVHTHFPHPFSLCYLSQGGGGRDDANGNNYTQWKKNNQIRSQESAASCPGWASYAFIMWLWAQGQSPRPMPRAHTLRTQPCQKGRGREGYRLVAQHPPEVWGPGLTLWSTRRWSWKGRRHWIPGKDSMERKHRVGNPGQRIG